MAAHVKLKEDVVVGILVGEGDRALSFQMDGVNQRHCAFIPIRLQIHALRRPRGAATEHKVNKEVQLRQKSDSFHD